MTNETIKVQSTNGNEIKVSIGVSKYDDSEYNIKFSSWDGIFSYYLETILFDQEGLPTRIDQGICLDGGRDVNVLGSEMAKVRKWAWSHVKRNLRK